MTIIPNVIFGKIQFKVKLLLQFYSMLDYIRRDHFIFINLQFQGMLKTY